MSEQKCPREVSEAFATVLEEAAIWLRSDPESLGVLRGAADVTGQQSYLIMLACKEGGPVNPEKSDE